MPSNDQLNQRQQFEDERLAAERASRLAQEQARQHIEHKKENPEFAEVIRELGLDSAEFPWLTAQLGPKGADAHFIGQRGPEYEREVKWLTRNEAERVIAEGSPGRLCRGNLRLLAQRKRDRGDKEVTDEWTQDERRALRDAMEAVANYKSLAVNARGIRALSEVTTVSKTEKAEEASSWRERLAGAIG